MIRRPPRYTRTDPTVPYSMLFRAKRCARRKESEAARYREHEIVATGAIVCGDDFEDSLTDFGGRQHLGLAQRRRGHARAIAHDEWLAWPNVEGPPLDRKSTRLNCRH